MARSIWEHTPYFKLHLVLPDAHLNRAGHDVQIGSGDLISHAFLNPLCEHVQRVWQNWHQDTDHPFLQHQLDGRHQSTVGELVVMILLYCPLEEPCQLQDVALAMLRSVICSFHWPCESLRASTEEFQLDQHVHLQGPSGKKRRLDPAYKIAALNVHKGVHDAKKIARETGGDARMFREDRTLPSF